ncbi:unnamed protein product [Bursaphelenchus okinawaensis]|uniref:Uncharacterized protein n=1 Tax=Bursaphelenchus okinawaensis TaxID=465554 RepID=A0A811KKE3_9BILA|nr:unnamed protein product [Bursaphelenchus okinawaensis]CAG9105511.1 unnamed protein product [Bursaphelenchus okinawaensis]
MKTVGFLFVLLLINAVFVCNAQEEIECDPDQTALWTAIPFALVLLVTIAALVGAIMLLIGAASSLSMKVTETEARVLMTMDGTIRCLIPYGLLLDMHGTSLQSYAQREPAEVAPFPS